MVDCEHNKEKTTFVATFLYLQKPMAKKVHQISSNSCDQDSLKNTDPPWVFKILKNVSEEQRFGDFLRSEL